MKHNWWKNRKPGDIWYLTYHLIFPDGDAWIDQVTFASPLDIFLTNTKFSPKENPTANYDLMRKGESKWKDNNGVTHLVRIEEKKKERKWGNKKALM